MQPVQQIDVLCIPSFTYQRCNSLSDTGDLCPDYHLFGGKEGEGGGGGGVSSSTKIPLKGVELGLQGMTRCAKMGLAPVHLINERALT